MPGQNITVSPSENAALASVPALSAEPLLQQFSTHTAALSAHVIEPELLLSTPRPIAPDGFNRIQVGLMGWNLLRYGRALPAIIVAVEPQSDNHYRIVFNYPGQEISRAIEHRIVTAEQVTQLGIYQGQTFTLLVNPSDEHDILPYFLSVAYKRLKILPVPPSPVELLAVGDTLADPGVEAELYDRSSHRLIWSHSVIKLRLIFLNIVAAYFFFGIWLLQSRFFPLSMFVCALIAGLFWASVEIWWLRQRFFLLNGYAVTATVESVKPLAFGDTRRLITYRYPLPHGKIGHDEVYLSLQDATRFGIPEQGSQFTLLRDPDNGYSVCPYFKINIVEIAGAMPPRIKSNSRP